ncbi:MAG: efflux RND transporter permease subunit, partial [Tannerellaceae bacterium]
MRIYETAVKKPISTLLIFIGIMVVGLFSYTRLAVDLYPDIEMNQLTVITNYRGASASDVETNVTRPLENMLNTVDDLKKLTSKSKENISLVTLEFEYGTDINVATSDVRDKIDMVKGALPDGVDQPIIFKLSTDMIPVIILSATATESVNALYKILDEKVVSPLNRINGVGAVSISGAPKRQIQVYVSPDKLEAYNLTIEKIADVIAKENMNIPAGSFDIGTETYSLRVEGEFKDSDQLNNIVVGSDQGRNVYLKDIAKVIDATEEKAQESFTNGIQGASIVVQKQSGSNTVDIAQQIRKKIPELQGSLPPDIQLSVVMDTSEFIEASITSLVDSVMYAGLFVIVVVIFFLGRWRATFIIILTVPMSLIGSFIYLMATGGTLNIISLSSLSIAIGMVVDDAIVVLENITKHIERGSTPKEAAIYATNEVAVAVVASTLTIVAVFFPLTLVTGLAGVMFKQLGWTVTIVVSLSTLVALTLTPMLCSQLLKNDPKQGKVFRILYAPIEKVLDWLDTSYARLLNFAVRHRISSMLFCLLIF